MADGLGNVGNRRSAKARDHLRAARLQFFRGLGGGIDLEPMRLDGGQINLRVARQVKHGIDLDLALGAGAEERAGDFMPDPAGQIERLRFGADQIAAPAGIGA